MPRLNEIEAAKAALDAARDALETAALNMVRAHCLDLSNRFPSRLISYEAGNGARGVRIARRKRLERGDWNLRDAFDLTWAWPRYIAGSPVLDELEKLEADTDLPWLATDCLYFRNGVELEGRP